MCVAYFFCLTLPLRKNLLGSKRKAIRNIYFDIVTVSKPGFQQLFYEISHFKVFVSISKMLYIHLKIINNFEMFVIQVAKWSGDLFNNGLYDIHVELKGVPLLGWEPSKNTERYIYFEVKGAVSSQSEQSFNMAWNRCPSLRWTQWVKITGSLIQQQR